MKENQITSNLELMVINMKNKEKNKDKTQIITQIKKHSLLTDKCILAREFLSPQSNDMEKIIKEDLCIGEPLNKISGDGHKNGVNYEIKYSGHCKQSIFNFVQIRPDHDIDYYILIGYNMYDNDNVKGKAYTFKISSKNMYDLVMAYGGYAHGTCTTLGKITNENLKGRNCEYVVRCNQIGRAHV